VRPTAFRAGALTGVLLFAAAASAVYLTVRVAHPPPYDFEASTAGADLSRHGAHSVEIRTTHGSLMRQTCNGACDDLWYKYKVAGENGIGVEVRDSAGDCLSCGGGLYVDSSGGEVGVVRVAGADKLRATAGYFEHQADGSLTPLKVGGQASPEPNPKP